MSEHPPEQEEARRIAELIVRDPASAGVFYATAEAQTEVESALRVLLSDSLAPHKLMEADQRITDLTKHHEEVERKLMEAERENERLRKAIRTLAWSLACYEFRGQDISLGEKADEIETAALRSEEPAHALAENRREAREEGSQ